MRVLIADDEPIIRLGLKAMLEEMGHEVITAANGREAIQQAQRHLPDIAILDIKMPYTDGLQAAATLNRQHPLPIVMLTAFSETELIERATDLPIQGYLIKPVSQGELAAAMAVAQKRFEETVRLKAEAAALEEKLESRKVVERAKSKLMATGLNEEEAYRFIQDQARETRRSMRQVAEAILKE